MISEQHGNHTPSASAAPFRGAPAAETPWSRQQGHQVPSASAAAFLGARGAPAVETPGSSRQQGHQDPSASTAALPNDQEVPDSEIPANQRVSRQVFLHARGQRVALHVRPTHISKASFLTGLNVVVSYDQYKMVLEEKTKLEEEKKQMDEDPLASYKADFVWESTDLAAPVTVYLQKPIQNRQGTVWELRTTGVT